MPEQIINALRFPDPVYLFWSEYDTSATQRGWGGDDIYRCRECPEWQGDSESAPRHSRLHKTPSLDTEQLRRALLSLAHHDPGYDARLDSGDYGRLDRPSEFAAAIAAEYARQSLSGVGSKSDG